MSDRKDYLSTREVASFLDVNEKAVYALISQKGLPATKATGKWLFPRMLVEQWLMDQTVNRPGSLKDKGARLLIIAGSHDILLEKTLALFNRTSSGMLGVFGNVGSAGGLSALENGLCDVGTSHLMQADEEEYNFDFLPGVTGEDSPVVVNFCRREQGLLVARGNPKGISGIPDLGRAEISIANRPRGTGTRVLLDRELVKAGLRAKDLRGYEHEFRDHLEVGLEVLNRRADAAPGIRAVAPLLGLDFVPLRWERYDLVISKSRFFNEPVQRFVGVLLDPPFRELASRFEGYDVSSSGKTVFQKHDD